MLAYGNEKLVYWCWWWKTKEASRVIKKQKGIKKTQEMAVVHWVDFRLLRSSILFYFQINNCSSWKDCLSFFVFIIECNEYVDFDLKKKKKKEVFDVVWSVLCPNLASLWGLLLRLQQYWMQLSRGVRVRLGRWMNTYSHLTFKRSWSLMQIILCEFIIVVFLLVSYFSST